MIHKDCKKYIINTKEITVVFPNGSKFNLKLMLNQIANDFDGSISCIVQNKETNLSFSIDYLNKEKVRVKFIDTLKHTKESIDTLSNNLSNGFSKKKLCENCKNTWIYYSDYYKCYEREK